MPKIVLISGTDRPDSKPLHLARLAEKKYHALGLETEILSLTDYPFHAIIGGKYDSETPEIQSFNQKLLQADGLVFFIPEYNGSFPGALKFALDHLPY